MKVYILTSVALFAEYGDLDSLDSPSVQTRLFLSHDKAQKTMAEQLESERAEAEASGYEDIKTELNESDALFLNDAGSGCSYNEVRWEITEHDVAVQMRDLSDEYEERLKNIVKAYGKPIDKRLGERGGLRLLLPYVICVGGWLGEDSEFVDELTLIDGRLGIGTEICGRDTSELPTDDLDHLLEEINEQIEYIRLSQEYFQPELIATKDVPENLASFQVFPTEEDCKTWMDRNGYLEGEYTIQSYSGEDIEDPTWLNGDGEVIYCSDIENVPSL